MKTVFQIFIFLLLQLYSYSQVNIKGRQDKKIYYISTEKRLEFGIESIIEVVQLNDGETGGMHENWDITTVVFDSVQSSIDWFIMKTDDDFEFDYDSIVDEARYINGTVYNFENGKLKSLGGSGYGAFDWDEYYYKPNSLIIVKITCNGHCADLPDMSFSKEIYKNDLLTTIIQYGNFPEYDSNYEEVFTLDLETCSEKEFDQELSRIFDGEIIGDTTFFEYDKYGNLVKRTQGKYIKTYQPNDNEFDIDPTIFKYYQCYIQRQTFQAYMKNKIGYLPKQIIFEIGDSIEVDFYWNEKDGKYYFMY